MTKHETAIYEAIDAFQRTHRLPGLQHAQIRALLAEHLDRALPAAAVAPPTADRAAVIAATARACAEHLRDTYSDMWTADAARSLELHAARIERGEPTALLRRMADEAAVSGPCVVGEQQNETPEAEAGCAHCGGDHSWDDCEAYTALVSGEQPSTDKEPEPGDRVRVTYEGTWLADDDPRTLLVGNHSGDVWRNIAPDHARVEVLPAAEVPE